MTVSEDVTRQSSCRNSVIRHLAHDHRGRAGLPLREGRRPEQEARERVAGAVEQRRPAGDRRGELEIAAVLEEPEHVPVELARVAAELDRVVAGAPRHALADLEIVVPVLARRAQQRIANRIVSLDIEQRQAVGVFAAESDAGDPELSDDVRAVRRFAVPVHAHPREAEARLGQQPTGRRTQQRDREVVHAIVVVRAEARQVLRREASLVTQAVAAEDRRSVSPCAIETNVVAVVFEARARACRDSYPSDRRGSAARRISPGPAATPS